ncbi:MAG TPA: hypothetical protein PLN79_15080, partial [bacterium]|nr:hypothetical protein [bacterium]
MPHSNLFSFQVLGILWLVFFPSCVNANSGDNSKAFTLITDDGESIISELDYFKVPESRDGNSSRELSLAYLKIPSTSQNPGHPIIYLSGGPGNSA